MNWKPLGYSVALLLCLGTSCSDTNPTISDRNYDKSCSSDADCAPVWTGDVCTCDDVGAINQSALQTYSNDKSALQEECSSIPTCDEPTGRWRATCNGSTCTVRSRPEDANTSDATADTAASSDGSDGYEGDVADAQNSGD